MFGFNFHKKSHCSGFKGNEEHISFYWSIKYGSSSMWSGRSDYNEIVDDTLEADVHEISDA